MFDHGRGTWDITMITPAKHLQHDKLDYIKEINLRLSHCVCLLSLRTKCMFDKGHATPN